MAEPTATEKAQAEIPFSLLEYTAVFKKPIFEAWAAPGSLVSAVLSALDPFGFKLEGVESKTHSEKLNEYAFVFRRNPTGLTFTVALGKLTVLAENLDWTESEKFITTVTAGVKATLQSGRGEIQSHHLALGMHIQIKTKPRKEVTAPLLSHLAFRLLDGVAISQGIILQQEKSLFVIDTSLAYANALFVRINREHPSETSFQKMAEILLGDEKRLYDVLRLEGTL